MEGKALKRAVAHEAQVVSIMTARAFEQMLGTSGFKRVDPSKLGCAPSELSVWLGQNYYVIMIAERVVIGTSSGADEKLRTTLRELDSATLQRLAADRHTQPSPPSGLDDAPPPASRSRRRA